MAQEPNEIREHIDAKRAKLGDDLEEIEHRMKDAVDWRAWYRKNTTAMLGAAVAGGFLLSMAIGHSPSEEETPAQGANGVFADEFEEKREPRRERSRFRIGPRISQHLNGLTDILDNTVGAFLGVANSKLQDLVSQSIPGFREQYSEAQRRRGRM
jgi:hypothetical protein